MGSLCVAAVAACVGTHTLFRERERARETDTDTGKVCGCVCVCVCSVLHVRTLWMVMTHTSFSDSKCFLIQLFDHRKRSSLCFVQHGHTNTDTHTHTHTHTEGCTPTRPTRTIRSNNTGRQRNNTTVWCCIQTHVSLQQLCQECIGLSNIRMVLYQ